MIPCVTMRAALADPKLFGDVLDGDSWIGWRTLLIAAMGETLVEHERALFKQLTGGREREPGQRVEEFVAIVGRRAASPARWRHSPPISAAFAITTTC